MKDILPSREAARLIENLSNDDGNVNENVELSYRIQSLNVGMQPPGRFSAVVFRNRT